MADVPVQTWVLALICGVSPDVDRPIVEAVVAGAEADREAVRARLEGFLNDEPVELRVAMRDDPPALDALVRPHEGHETLAHVIVDLGEREVRLLVVDGPWQRALARRIELTDGLDEVVLEEIGYAVETSVRALLDGEAIGVTLSEATEALEPVDARPQRSEAPPPAEPPAAVPRLERDTEARPPPEPTPVVDGSLRRLEIGAGYDVFAWSPTGAPLHGPRIEGAFLRHWSRVAAGASIDVDWRVPVTYGRGDLGVRVQSLAVRSHVEAWLPVGVRVALGLGLGPGLDVRDEAPVALAASGDPGPRRARALPVVSTRLGVRLRVTAWPRSELFVHVAPGLEVDPLVVAYVTDDGDTTILRPWRVRPGATISLRWSRFAPWSR